MVQWPQHRRTDHCPLHALRALQEQLQRVIASVFDVSLGSDELFRRWALTPEPSSHACARTSARQHSRAVQAERSVALSVLCSMAASIDAFR
jgi:hypothetical protein